MKGNELLEMAGINTAKDEYDIKADKFDEIVKQMSTLYRNKNRDYGDSFGHTVKEYGNIAALTRITDKFNRLKSLILNKQQFVKDESIIDTLQDLASYCIMFQIELDKK